jgi:hypothetical protein
MKIMKLINRCKSKGMDRQTQISVAMAVFVIMMSMQA